MEIARATTNMGAPDQHRCALSVGLLYESPEQKPGRFIAVAIPKGFEGQIRPRSGIAYKNGVTVLNSPGTIDSDYRGEVMVILINHGTDNYEIKHGERIAQLVISPVIRASFTLVESLDFTIRNAKGFGSTGNK